MPFSVGDDIFALSQRYRLPHTNSKREPGTSAGGSCFGETSEGLETKLPTCFDRFVLESDSIPVREPAKAIVEWLLATDLSKLQQRQSRFLGIASAGVAWDFLYEAPVSGPKLPEVLPPSSKAESAVARAWEHFEKQRTRFVLTLAWPIWANSGSGLSSLGQC